MIIYWLDVIACGLVVFAELIGALLIAMLTQLFFYRVLGINLYRSINRGLNRLDRYFNSIF